MNDKNQTRNLNPTPEAVFAMIHWGKSYSEYGGGSMDFYDSLNQPEKQLCVEAIKKIRESLNKTVR